MWGDMPRQVADGRWWNVDDDTRLASLGPNSPPGHVIGSCGPREPQPRASQPKNSLLRNSSSLWILRFFTKLPPAPPINLSSSATQRNPHKMPPKRIVVERSAPRSRAPKGVFASTYETLTSAENAAMVRSITAFGVSTTYRAHWEPCIWLRPPRAASCVLQHGLLTTV